MPKPNDWKIHFLCCFFSTQLVTWQSHEYQLLVLLTWIQRILICHKKIQLTFQKGILYFSDETDIPNVICMSAANFPEVLCNS